MQEVHIDAGIPSEKYFDIVEKLRAYLQSSASKLKDFNVNFLHN